MSVRVPDIPGPSTMRTRTGKPKRTCLVWTSEDAKILAAAKKRKEEAKLRKGPKAGRKVFSEDFKKYRAQLRAVDNRLLGKGAKPGPISHYTPIAMRDFRRDNRNIYKM
jgi:hypothetical protein